MLHETGFNSIDELIDKTVPPGIRMTEPLRIPTPLSENEYLRNIKTVSLKNKIFSNYIGQGYYGTFTPSVIQRNILKTPDGTPNILLIRPRFRKVG